MNFKEVNLGSFVWDNESADWFQVRSAKVLVFVNKNWETRFTGIPLTENNISLFFSDFEPFYEDESYIKYQLFKNEQMLKCIATFYGQYVHKDEPHYVRYSIAPEDNVVLQFGDGNDHFKNFYQLKNNTRTFVNCVHELQNLF